MDEIWFAASLTCSAPSLSCAEMRVRLRLMPRVIRNTQDHGRCHTHDSCHERDGLEHDGLFGWVGLGLRGGPRRG